MLQVLQEDLQETKTENVKLSDWPIRTSEQCSKGIFHQSPAQLGGRGGWGVQTVEVFYKTKPVQFLLLMVGKRTVPGTERSCDGTDATVSNLFKRNQEPMEPQAQGTV